MGNTDDFRGIRLVSWDVDGTLFSYCRLAWELVRNRPFTLMELVETWEFHRTVEMQRRTAECAVITSEMERVKVPQSRERKILDRILRRVPPRRAAALLIQRFAAAGIPQVALSDFECGYKLHALGLSASFVKSYSCEDLGFWKPSPIPLSRIQEEFGISPEEHLHIGDRRDTDGEACSRNGCRFMLVDSFPRFWRTFNMMCSM